VNGATVCLSSIVNTPPPVDGCGSITVGAWCTWSTLIDAHTSPVLNELCPPPAPGSTLCPARPSTWSHARNRIAWLTSPTNPGFGRRRTRAEPSAGSSSACDSPTLSIENQLDPSSVYCHVPTSGSTPTTAIPCTAPGLVSVIKGCAPVLAIKSRTSVPWLF